jgi:D-alanyl-D-alanine carboxypeptidase
LIISSAWRSLETQEYFAKKRGEFAAIPGRSEHQLGTAIDVDRKGALEEDYFGDSNVYLWMKENASRFGFVQSFTLEYQELTGTPEEPWHWRFVGKDIAEKIQKEGSNLNQYLYDHNNKKEDLESRSILSQASEFAFNKIKNFIMVIYSFLSKH